MGLIPFFPGGANVTGNIAITMVLAICTFLAVNIFGTKTYWKDIFWPDVPWWLKVPVPMMPFIEFFGIFTKPFALMIRPFCQYAGRAHGNAGAYLPDIHLGQYGTCFEWNADRGIGVVQYLYECT